MTSTTFQFADIDVLFWRETGAKLEKKEMFLVFEFGYKHGSDTDSSDGLISE